MDTNLREEKERFTTETQRPRSETYREGSRSLWALCLCDELFVSIRVHSRFLSFICVNLRSSAVELSVLLRRRSICGLEFSP